MPRITEATHATRHPHRKGVVLLMRMTRNPTDPAGAFGVLKEITEQGFNKHYKEQCKWIDEKPSNSIANAQGDLDALIYSKGAIVDQMRQARAVAGISAETASSHSQPTEDLSSEYEAVGLPVYEDEGEPVTEDADHDLVDDLGEEDRADATVTTGNERLIDRLRTGRSSGLQYSPVTGRVKTEPPLQNIPVADAPTPQAREIRRRFTEPVPQIPRSERGYDATEDVLNRFFSQFK